MQTESNKLIEKYLEKVLSVNKKINLTRITEPSDAHLLHLEDSLSVLEELNAAPQGRYGDLGSGGGFPGVPLGITSKRQTVLIDSVKKKMAAVKEILDTLGLSDKITTYDGRIEELAIEQPATFSVLTARALSSLDSLVELASPLLQMNGQLICLKAQIDEKEIKRAQNIEGMTGMRLISSREFILSDQNTFRTVLVFEKINKPSVTLPRRIGLAQKSPLKPKSPSSS